SVAQASPLASSIGIPSQHYSPIENIGCRHAGDTCPYGKRIVRHSGRGTTCEPCESKEDDSSEKKGKSSSQKEESSDGGHPSGSSHYDEGRGHYDRQDEGYAHGDRGYDRRREGYDRDEGYDRRDEGYAHGYQGRDGGCDDRDEGSSRGDDGYDRQGYGRGSGGYVGTKAIAIGGMDLHVNGTTAKDPLQVGGLTTSVPMDGKSATACNLAKGGTAASKRQFHG